MVFIMGSEWTRIKLCITSSSNTSGERAGLKFGHDDDEANSPIIQRVEGILTMALSLIDDTTWDFVEKLFQA